MFSVIHFICKIRSKLKDFLVGERMPTEENRLSLRLLGNSISD